MGGHSVPLPEHDYKGMKLCQPCWNGQHWLPGEYGHGKVNCCLRGGCECPCTDVKPPRKAKPNKSLQTSIDVPALEIGPRS